MADFEYFCPKNIWDKFQFQVPTSNTSEKNKDAIIISTFKIHTKVFLK